MSPLHHTCVKYILEARIGILPVMSQNPLALVNLDKPQHIVWNQPPSVKVCSLSFCIVKVKHPGCSEFFRWKGTLNILIGLMLAAKLKVCNIFMLLQYIQASQYVSTSHRIQKLSWGIPRGWPVSPVWGGRRSKQRHVWIGTTYQRETAQEPMYIASSLSHL